MEVRLALQRGRQVVEAQRQLPLERGVLLAEGWESPERALADQLLNGCMAPGDGVSPSGFWVLHRRRRALGRRSRAEREGWDGRRLVWRRKWEILQCVLDKDKSTSPPTFPLVLQLVVPLAAGRVRTEGALANKRGAASIEGRGDAALLLPALFPLQTGGKGTADSVAQPLSLRGHKALMK